MPSKKNTQPESQDSGGVDMSHFEEATEKGYWGQKVDPTPNHAYTVEGVTAGEPTPETNEELHEQARTGQPDDGGGEE